LGQRIARTLTAGGVRFSAPVEPGVDERRLADLGSSDVAAWLPDGSDYVFELFAGEGVPFFVFAESALWVRDDIPDEVDHAVFFEGRYYITKKITNKDELFLMLTSYSDHTIMPTLALRTSPQELRSAISIEYLDELISYSFAHAARAYDLETYIVGVRVH
jgi:hypothetical protein